MRSALGRIRGALSGREIAEGSRDTQRLRERSARASRGPRFRVRCVRRLVCACVRAWGSRSMSPGPRVTYFSALVACFGNKPIFFRRSDVRFLSLLRRLVLFRATKN